VCGPNPRPLGLDTYGGGGGEEEERYPDQCETFSLRFMIAFLSNFIFCVGTSLEWNGFLEN